ncbi:MAG TPA: MoaD/ThiS family protein, partial [Rhabdochlamydiaceae bacterium]
MKIQVNDQWLELAEACSAKELADKMNLRGPHEALAIDINGTLYDLQHLVKDGDKIKFISFDEPLGKEVFWHTSAHVLAQAILRLFPNAKPTIGPPIENGFYYDFANVTITEED